MLPTPTGWPRSDRHRQLLDEAKNGEALNEVREVGVLGVALGSELVRAVRACMVVLSTSSWACHWSDFHNTALGMRVYNGAVCQACINAIHATFESASDVLHRQLASVAHAHAYCATVLS